LKGDLFMREGSDRPRRAGGIDVVESGPGVVVRQAEPRRLHQLNNTAAIVLELCDGQHSVAEIAGALAEAFGLSVPPLAETVACVADLRRAGLLRREQADDPFGFFAAIYCLNLDQRPDRWEAARRRFSVLDIADRVERFAAVPTPGNHHEGCARSWRKMVAEARDRGLPNFLGLEDDAIFLDNTHDVVSAALAELAGLDWDLLYLGGAAWEESADIPGHAALQSPRGLTCTHALAVNHTAYDRLLAGIPESDGIDEWLTRYLAIDQYLSYHVNAGYYRAYVLNPRVATQVELTTGGVLDAPLRDRYTIR
jgi:Coenzyme PQQ synthesis protein D (PqqD)